MFQLNPFAISGLIIAVFYLPLLLLIAIKGKTKLTKIFSLHILSVFIWGFASFFIGATSNLRLAILSWKIGTSGVAFIPVFFIHAVSIMQKKQMRAIILFAYFQAFIFLYISWSNQMYTTYELVFNSFYYERGSLYYLIFFSYG